MPHIINEILNQFKGDESKVVIAGRNNWYGTYRVESNDYAYYENKSLEVTDKAGKKHTVPVKYNRMKKERAPPPPRERKKDGYYINILDGNTGFG